MAPPAARVAPRASQAAPRLTKTERAACAQRLWDGLCASPYVFLGLAKTLDEHAPEGEPPVRQFPLCAVCAAQAAANEVVVLREGLSVCAAHGRRDKPDFRGLVVGWGGGRWGGEGGG